VQVETECETVLYSKLFHYQYVNCELLRNSQSELTAIWGLGSERKRNGQREGKVMERLFGQDAAISMEEEAIFVQFYKSRASDLDLAHPGCVLTWRSSCAHFVAIHHLPTRRGDFREITKCPYHVTVDLDLDFEHTLDVS